MRTDRSTLTSDPQSKPGRRRAEAACPDRNQAFAYKRWSPSEHLWPDIEHPKNLQWKTVSSEV